MMIFDLTSVSQGVDSSLKRPKLDQDNDYLSSGGDDPMQVDQTTDMVVVSQDSVAGTSNVPPPAHQLPEVMNDMRLREEEPPHANRRDNEDKVSCFCYIWILSPSFKSSSSHLHWFIQDMEPPIVNGCGTETGQVITTTLGGRDGKPKQVCVSKPTFY